MTVQPWQEMTTRSLVDHISEGGNKGLTWRGYTCWKNPLDLMIYQEIVHEVRPTLIVETGTHAGGSALFWLDMLRACGVEGPEVVSIDIDRTWGVLPVDDRLVYLDGSSTDLTVIEAVELIAASGHGPVLVNLDSNHAFQHVYDELTAYSQIVTTGSYVIVEDGIDDFRWERPGAHAATIAWLSHHPGVFTVDKHRERLGITNCPDGYLRRL